MSTRQSLRQNKMEGRRESLRRLGKTVEREKLPLACQNGFDCELKLSVSVARYCRSSADSLSSLLV